MPYTLNSSPVFPSFSFAFDISLEGGDALFSGNMQHAYNTSYLLMFEADILYIRLRTFDCIRTSKTTAEYVLMTTYETRLMGINILQAWNYAYNNTDGWKIRSLVCPSPGHVYRVAWLISH